MRKGILIVVFTLLSGFAAAQGSRYDNFTWTTTPVGANAVPVVKPAAGATVTVCSYPATVNGSGVCTNTVTIYSNSTLTTPASNPVTSDAQGNFGFWLASGTYAYTVTGSGLTAATYSFTLGTVDAASTSSTNHFVGTNTFSSFNNEIWVDGTTYPLTHVGVQAAIDAAPWGGVVHVPNTVSLTRSSGAQLVIDKAMTLECGAWGTPTAMIVGASVGATQDVLSIAPATRDADGIFIRNCMFLPASGTPARRCISVDTTGSFSLSKLAVEHVYCGTFGGKGFYSNNSLTDGFYTSWLRDNQFMTGIEINSGGDSLHITGNTIAGSNIGIDIDLANGAGVTEISGNNITSSGGCIKLANYASQSKIYNNQCEGAIGATYSNNAIIDIDGGPAATNVYATDIFANYIAPISATQDGIRVNNATKTWIHNNYIGRTASGVDYRITANAVDTTIEDNFESPWPDTVTSVLADLGTGTQWSRRDTGFNLMGNRGLPFNSTAFVAGTAQTGHQIITFRDASNNEKAFVDPVFAIGTTASFQNPKTDVTLANGANANVAIGNAGFVKIVGPSAGYSISGFAGGADGRILRVYNSVAQQLTLTNNATSTAANRILTLTGADVVLRAGQSSATFIYDATQSLWILVGTN